jgi:hypothetical protein
MEHSVDLAAKTFVQAISPSSSRKILKMKKALQVACNDSATDDSAADDTVPVTASSTFDLDDLDARLADFNFNDEDDEETGDGEEEDEVDAADSAGKALLLVKQECSLDFPYVGPASLTSNLFRFVLLLKLEHFLRSLVNRLKYPFYSFSSGFVHVGHLCMHSSTDF